MPGSSRRTPPSKPRSRSPLPPRPSIIDLSGVDVTQKMMEALSNVCIRSVLFSIRDEAKDAARVASELNLSVSVVYKSLATLEYLALAEVERFEISPVGKKIKMYRSRIGKVEIVIGGQEPVLSLHRNTARPAARRGGAADSGDGNDGNDDNDDYA